LVHLGASALLNRHFEPPLLLALLYLTNFSCIFVIDVQDGIVPLDVVALNVIRLLYFFVHACQRHTFGEVRALKPAKNVDVPVLQHASAGMVPALIELRLQLQPPIFFDVIALHSSLTELEVLKLEQISIASTSDHIYKAIVSLCVSEVSSTGLHKLPFLEHVFLQNILVILFGIIATDDKCPEFDIRDYGFISLRLHSWRDLDLMLAPRAWLCIGNVLPNVAVEKVTQLVPAGLGLTRVRILLDLSFLPLHVRKIAIDESWPDGHGLELQEPRNDELIKC
jgi:hypothetical protein